MVAILLFQILERPALDYEGVFGFAVIIIREGITGLLIGFAASVCNSIILLAGNMIDMEIGLSMATEYDPMNNTQVNITGQLYNYLLLLLLIATDMHHYILHAVVDSYKLIPVNGQCFNGTSVPVVFNLYDRSVCDRIPDHFTNFCSYDDTELHFGNYGKSCTAVNMFAIGMQMKILIGFLIMFLTIRLLPSISNFVFKEMKKLIVSFIEGMY